MKRLLLTVTLLASACGTASHGGAPGNPSEPDAAAERLYRSRCAACHRLRDPSEQTRERWAWAVDKYGPRAHLNDEEKTQILAYLQSHAKDAAAPAGNRP